MVTTLDYYYRQGCGLCDDMVRELDVIAPGLNFSLSGHDIDLSPVLKEKYNDQVPVLAHGDEIICRYFLEEDSLREYLKQHA